MANEIFTLEAINAQHGDALLLHFGSKKDPKHLLIDGGPVGVYKDSLAPRLEQLRVARGKDSLPLEHTFVTHLDSDHIRGVLDLATHIRKGDAPADCRSFWFNTFADAMTELPPEVADARKRVSAQPSSVGAVLASVAEGQSLRDTVKALFAKVNDGSGKLLFADKKGMPLDVGAGLKVTLVCPSKEHLRKLAADWKKKAKPTDAETSAYVDNSVYNLSSLVFVVEAKGPGGKKARMLLTGDARGDHVLAGLDASGFLAKGKAQFDILKVGHHGSDRDFAPEFFRDVTARHYVISANGRDDNPSTETLEWIGAGAKAPFTIWMTNETNPLFPVLAKNIAAAQKHQKNLKANMKFRKADALSIKIDLFAPFTL